MNPLTLLFLCIAGFFAALIDSIAGGGGLISIPAFIMAGVPPHFTLGTNKFAATFNSLTSSIRYIQENKINKNLLLVLIPFTFIGAWAGVRLVIEIPTMYLSFIITIMILLVGVYTLLKKNLGMRNQPFDLTPARWMSSILIALIIGFYDGFFGPGTGSFLMFMFIKLFGLDFLRAAGNARVLNFISNAISLVLFAIHGKILYAVGLPVGIAMMLGALVGSKIAFRKGAGLVRPIFIIITFLAAAKVLFDILSYG